MLDRVEKHSARSARLLLQGRGFARGKTERSLPEPMSRVIILGATGLALPLGTRGRKPQWKAGDANAAGR